jgi:hypothetical protein
VEERKVEELVEYIIKSLVSVPEEVKVNKVESEKVTILELKVADSDIGKVIGKQGKVIKAIRTVVNAAATKSSKKVVLEVLD